MPDDFGGPQVHVMYIVPADGTDNQLDTNGTVEQSITRFQNWFLGQTGNQGVRIDTYHGVPDITFFRLPRTDAQMMSAFPFVIWGIGAYLASAQFNQPAKEYAVFYDGHDPRVCGNAKSPALAKLGVIYLQAFPAGQPAPCQGFGTGTKQFGYFDLGMVHEILHAIGFSPPCAPHRSNDGFGDHVNDSPTDIMYAADATHTAPWDVFNAVLDFNHDDYYRAHIPGCPDLSDSPYLTPMISVDVVAGSGTGTVVSTPAGISCPQTCSAFLTPPVTLTATPGPGQKFTGWTGSCSGGETCTLNNTGSASANFEVVTYARSLLLRLHGRQLLGSLHAQGGGSSCVAGMTVVVEHRLTHGWKTLRRLVSGPGGRFAVPIPTGRASYRAIAPEATTAEGSQCGPAASPVVSSR
jgi:hypothetical protein